MAASRVKARAGGRIGFSLRRFFWTFLLDVSLDVSLASRPASFAKGCNGIKGENGEISPAGRPCATGGITESPPREREYGFDTTCDPEIAAPIRAHRKTVKELPSWRRRRIVA